MKLNVLVLKVLFLIEFPAVIFFSHRKSAARSDPRTTASMSSNSPRAHTSLRQGTDFDWVDLGQDFDDLSVIPSAPAGETPLVCERPAGMYSTC